MAEAYVRTLKPADELRKFDPKESDIARQYYLPDDETKARVCGYVEADRLLEVEGHSRLFNVKDRDVKASYIGLDFAGMLTRLMRHYTFSPGFTVRALNPKNGKADKNVKRIMKNSKAVALFREVAESLPALGDAVIRVDLVEPERVGSSEKKLQAIMRYVKPHQVSVDLHPLDNRYVRGVTLAWLFSPSDFEGYGDDTQRLILLREALKPGTREFIVNWWDGEKLTAGPPLKDLFEDLPEGPQETGIDEIPVVFVHNNRKAGSFWGRSEFPRIRPIIEALENRMAQLDEVLEKHARPKLIVGPGTLDEEGRALLDLFDVIEVESSVLEKAVKPEYLTWDMQIEAIKHQIEKLEEYFFIFTETSPASFGLERDGSQVESARALRFKAHRTINKVEDTRDPFGDAVEDLLRIAQKLENSADYKYAISEVALEWPDPIIEDDSQEAQDYAMMRQNQLVSIRRAVQDLHDLSDEEAEREVAQIFQDEIDINEAQGSGAIPGLTPLGEAAPEAGLGTVAAGGAV